LPIYSFLPRFAGWKSWFPGCVGRHIPRIFGSGFDCCQIVGIVRPDSIMVRIAMKSLVRHFRIVTPIKSTIKPCSPLRKCQQCQAHNNSCPHVCQRRGRICCHPETPLRVYDQNRTELCYLPPDVALPVETPSCGLNPSQRPMCSASRTAFTFIVVIIQKRISRGIVCQISIGGRVNENAAGPKLVLVITLILLCPVIAVPPQY